METVNKIYTVFTSHRTTPHWTHKFLKKHFYHCYTFRQEKSDTLIIDMTYTDLEVFTIKNVSAETYAYYIKEKPNTIVLEQEYSLDLNNKAINFFNMLPTCVSITKLALSISSAAQTPFQLYKVLLKKGAEQI